METDKDYEVEGVQQEEISSERDVEIFEVSTEQTLQQLYHSWLGEVPAQGGIYTRDPRLTKIMNEKFASILLGELKGRINTNMHFSDLEEQDIIEISTITAEQIMDRLMYYYKDYEVKVEHMEPICNQVYDNLRILLTNARDGGMKQYKVARSKVIINKQQLAEQTQTQTAY